MTFRESTDKFIEASPWLEAKHEPAKMMLIALAEALDAQVLANDLQASLVGQYGLAYRALAKEAPLETDEVDELEKLLQEVNA